VLFKPLRSVIDHGKERATRDERPTATSNGNNVCSCVLYKTHRRWRSWLSLCPNRRNVENAPQSSNGSTVFGRAYGWFT